MTPGVVLAVDTETSGVHDNAEIAHATLYLIYKK